MALTKVSRGLLTTSIVDNGNATAITIDSNENVGIGTGSPATTLHIQSASEPAITLFHTGIMASQIGLDSLGSLTFGIDGSTGATELMRITSAGNLGIGTNNPASLLDVSSTGAVISTVRSTSTSGARQATLRLNVASTGGDDPAGRVQFTYGTGYTVAGSIEMTHTNPAMKFLTGTTEVMRISGSNVGINNPNPAQILSICNPANPNRNGMEIAIGAGDTSSNTIQNYNRATAAYTPLNIAGSILTFGVGTAATERMRIDSAGNLLVGTTSSSGDTANSKPVVAGNFTTKYGVTSIASVNTWTTVHTFGSNQGNFMVSMRASGTGNTAHNSVSIVAINESATTHTPLLSGSAVQIRIVGLSLQVYQNVFAGANISWSIMSIGN